MTIADKTLWEKRSAAQSSAPTGGPARGVAWRYEVRAVGPHSTELNVIADFAPGSPDGLAIDDGAEGFVHDVAFRTAEGWKNADRLGSGWSAPCRVSGCQIRYGFALAAAAAHFDDAETAIEAGGVTVAPPSTWLIRPSQSAEGTRFRFRVITEGGALFATGVAPAPEGATGTFEAATSDLDSATFAVFGPFHFRSLASGAEHVDVAIAPRGLPLAEGETVAWVQRAVDGLAHYFGESPISRTLVIVVPGTRGAASGVTLGDGGAAIVLRAGPGLNPAAARDDWVATHELVHVALSSISCADCRRGCRLRGTSGSNERTRGAERTGGARSSA